MSIDVMSPVLLAKQHLKHFGFPIHYAGNNFSSRHRLPQNTRCLKFIPVANVPEALISRPEPISALFSRQRSGTTYTPARLQLATHHRLRGQGHDQHIWGKRRRCVEAVDARRSHAENEAVHRG